ncbi:hypothetical protein ACFL12_01500 [Pseudomonadota bacterium]
MSARIYDFSAYRSSQLLRGFSQQTAQVCGGLHTLSGSLDTLSDELEQTGGFLHEASRYLGDAAEQLDERRALHERCIRAIDSGSLQSIEDMALHLQEICHR